MSNLYINTDKPIAEKKIFYLSMFFPVVFLVIIWSVKLLEISFNTSLAYLGVYPQKLNGLVGVVFSPLIHSDFKHLINNSVPFIILSGFLFYIYREIAYKIFFLIWLMTGLWVWCGAREAFHIGASGLVYGIAAFIFFSGIIRRCPRLASLSMIVIFLYGGMIWGIFPFIPDISWESHLSGGLSGLILAFFYRNEGPQRDRFEWEEDDDSEWIEPTTVEDSTDENAEKSEKLS